MISRSARVILALTAAAVGPVWGQDEDTPSALDILEDILLVSGTGVGEPNDVVRDRETIDTLRAALGSPETLNRVVDTFLTTDSGWQFLKDVNFEFMTFQADDIEQPGLGFSFDYQTQLKNHDLACETDGESCIRGLGLSFDMSGTFAFDKENNPQDLITAKLDFDYFQSTGGRARVDADRVLELEEAFVSASTPEEGEAAVLAIEGLVRPSLTKQFYYSVGGDVSFESNQQFTTKQTLYGVHLALDFKDWAGTSAWTTFNFLDYPFAALRALTGYDCVTRADGNRDCFQPSGTSWPTLLFRSSRVKPDDDDPRSLAGDSSEFTRMDFEASFRTPVARLADDELYITVNYRFYAENDPSPLVEAAELDQFEYYTVTIGGNRGMYLSYSDGKLPLAFADDQVVELGFRTHL